MQQISAEVIEYSQNSKNQNETKNRKQEEIWNDRNDA